MAPFKQGVRVEFMIYSTCITNQVEVHDNNSSDIKNQIEVHESHLTYINQIEVHENHLTYITNQIEVHDNRSLPERSVPCPRFTK